MSNTQTELSGLLLIDKPRDYSSHDIINIARKVLQTRKIGHSGTLDPMATGLLILLIGRTATKRQGFFQNQSKTYSATLKLGVQTDTWDAYGVDEKELPVPILTLEQIRIEADKLTGLVEQPIPFFSAKRINGKHMYDLFLKGHDLERAHNTITVHRWENIQLTAPDEIQFTLTCSSGTYVRSLAWLLAQALGTTGHISQLRRIKTGGFDVENALDGGELKNMDREHVLAHTLPADWQYTPAEEALRKQIAQRDRNHTHQLFEAGLIEKAEVRDARKEAARKMYEELRAAKVIRFEAEKAAFLARKKAETKAKELPCEK